tara:strand:+ start:814 stop:1143 length:330 start_codon:yes stop_codon:yes gene_type:complete
LNDNGQDVTLEVPLFIDNDLFEDDYGEFILQTSVSPDLDEKPVIKEQPFEEVINLIIEYHEEDGDYQELYKVSNGLLYQSERIREVADKLESSTHAVADLFNTSYEPPT